jgi:hypothetical protein
MRDFRDAKAMAHSLRDALKAKAVETTHSECLELIAKVFGFENWNILSAKVEAAQSSALDKRNVNAAGKAAPKPNDTLYCSFCRKSQHEVRKLIAGPTVFICDECIELCDEIIEYEEILRLLDADDERGDQSHSAAFAYVRGKSTEQLISDAERAKKHVERRRLALQQIKRKLSMRDGEALAEGDVLASPGFAYLNSKTREDLVALQRHHEHALKRYEDGQRMAATVLSERGR